MDTIHKAVLVCEEFSEHIYSDDERGSILINVNKEWFKPLCDRLRNEGLELVHETVMKKTITCVFIAVFFDDDDLDEFDDEDLDDEDYYDEL